MLYPGSSYVLDLLVLLPRVSHINIIKFSLTLIFQASLLYSLNLPSAQSGRLLLRRPGLTSNLTFLEECSGCYTRQCAFKPHHPAPNWKVTIGDPKLTRLNNFRIRLLVGCDGLEADAASFRSRTTNASSATRESLRMLHTSCLHALSLTRRG